MMRKPAQKSLENLYYNLDNLFKKFDILHCHHTAKKLDEADWIWHNDITIRELKLIVGVAPETVICINNSRLFKNFASYKQNIIIPKRL